MNVFITGGTTGIGLELARLYLAEGHRVGVCGRDGRKFDRQSPGMDKCLFYVADVADRGRLHDAIADFVGDQSLDVMIANAGVSDGGSGLGTDFDRARQIIATNVIGLLNTFEKALTYMRRDGKGHLVAMSSIAGRNGLPGAGPYSASKAAVTTLCESLAIDLRRDNIHVTIVSPGFVKTPLTDLNRHPMPFLISAAQAAGTIKRGIDATRVHVAFPWPMDLATSLLRILPRSIYVLMMRLYRRARLHG